MTGAIEKTVDCTVREGVDEHILISWHGSDVIMGICLSFNEHKALVRV